MFHSFGCTDNGYCASNPGVAAWTDLVWTVPDGNIVKSDVSFYFDLLGCSSLHLVSRFMSALAGQSGPTVLDFATTSPTSEDRSWYTRSVDKN